MRKISWLLVFFIFFSLVPTKTQAAGGMVWKATKLTSSANNKSLPKFYISDSKVYYVYREIDTVTTNKYQIWTAVSDLDGSNFVTTQRTSSNVDKEYPVIEVSGSKIYYAWYEYDGTSHYQIWTATMNIDGTGWLATQRTSTSFHSRLPSQDVDGAKIYYAYIEEDAGGDDQLWTAEMNVDGTGWSATQRTTTAYDVNFPRIEVVGTKIYYAFRNRDVSGKGQTATAVMNTDGTGFSWAVRTTSNYWKEVHVFDVLGSKQYFAWRELDGAGTNQIWTAEMNNDGTGFVETKRTFTTEENQEPDIMAFGNNVHLTWFRPDSGGDNQIWTATLDIDDGEWRPTQRTTSAFNKVVPQIQIIDPKIYYLWQESDGTYIQLWLGFESDEDIIEGGQVVTATVPSTLTFTIDGVASGNACANSGGNASVTSTASTIPFGIYTGAATKIACQTLTVSTNATDGYVITVEQNQDLTSGGSDTMNAFSGTYVAPTTWSSPPGSGTESYFGFTTDDTDYSDFQTNKYSSFAIDDKPYNIVYEVGPVANEVNVMSYQLEITDNQPAGVYTNNIMYIATATF